MNTKEFTDRHHREHDRKHLGVILDVPVYFIYLILYIFLTEYFIELLKLNTDDEKWLNIIFLSFIYFPIRFRPSALIKKNLLLCPECQYNFDQITPNHDRSNILQENKCPACHKVIIKN